MSQSVQHSLLLVLQALQVVFLWLHDWVPLPPLNDVRAVRSQDSLGRLVRITLIQSLPFTIFLVFSALHQGTPYPHWLVFALWLSYSMLFVGQLRAWWVPYLVKAEPDRALRYQVMFANTHAFLPERNGVVPNTAHIALHVLTAATLVVLFTL